MWGGVVSFAATAGEKVVYHQNFEAMTDPNEWSRITGLHSNSVFVYNEPLNHAFMYAPGSDNPYFYCCVSWGMNLLHDADNNSILEKNVSKLSFDFCIQSTPELTETTLAKSIELTVFTTITGSVAAIDNFRYHHSSLQEDFLFDFLQCSAGDGSEFEAVVNAPFEEQPDGSYYPDTTESHSFKVGEWYYVTLITHEDTRLVEYTVTDSSGMEIVKGSRTVPQEYDIDPNGLYLKTYGGSLLIDNINLSYTTADDYAGEPQITLCAVGTPDGVTENLDTRVYLVDFSDGETLHLTDTEGVTHDIEYSSCRGHYRYITDHSGVLSAWTTSGSATSAKNELSIECVPCRLPPVDYSVSAIETGYKRKYLLTCDNSNIEAHPTVYIESEFEGRDGFLTSTLDLLSGAEVEADQAGTFTIRARAFGYVTSELTIENNTPYYVRKVYDFARMTKDELIEAGFTDWQILNSSSTSGFTNWTGRKRLYYYDSATGEAVYPFGFVSDDNTTNVLEYAVIPATENPFGRLYFDDIEFYGNRRYNVNFCVALHLGLFSNETAYGVSNNKIIKVNNLRKGDVVVLNKIENYGGSTAHPYLRSTAEYYEQLAGDDVCYTAVPDDNPYYYYAECPIYRIDTMAAKITVYSEMDWITTGVEEVDTEAAVEADDRWYNLQGIPVASPSAPGIYIHGGRKVLVR